jgi:MFS family permease
MEIQRFWQRTWRSTRLLAIIRLVQSSPHRLKIYLTSRFLTTIAYQMESVAIGWQIYNIRKNPMDLGWAGLVQFLPMVIFSLWGGQVADRFERKRVIQTIHFFWALSAFGLFLWNFLGMVPLEAFLVFLAFQGTLRAFSNPSSQAFITQLASPQQLKRAVALSSSVFQTSSILGPMFGGLLYGWTGGGSAVYFMCVICLSISLTLLFFLNAEKTERTVEPVSWKSVFAGVEYVLKRRIILGAISLDLFAVLFGGAVALLPAYAADILKVGPTGLGVLRAAPGMGAILMSLYLAGRPIHRNVGFWLFFNVALFGLATLGFGLSRSLPLSVFFLFISGAADIVSVVIRMTLVQIETPASMRGRVSAVNSVFISASNELGEFESGLTAAWFGLVPAVVIGGLGTICVAAIWSRLFPELRKMQTLGS